jgi:hypothetical protein
LADRLASLLFLAAAFLSASDLRQAALGAFDRLRHDPLEPSAFVVRVFPFPGTPLAFARLIFS